MNTVTKKCIRGSACLALVASALSLATAFVACDNDLLSSKYSGAAASETEPTAAQKARGIWLVGGLSGSSVNNVSTTLDLYDPVPSAGHPQGKWFSSASTTGFTPVSFAGYAAYSGKLYVIGGFNSSGVVQNSVQIYDVTTDSWSIDATTMPTARANIHATVLNGKIYIMSGSSAPATTAWAGVPAPSGVCYEYVPGTIGVWTVKTGYTATNNTERYTYAYGNTIYSIGGRSAANAVAAIAHDGYIPSISLLTSATTELAMTAAPSVARTGIAGVVSKPSSFDHALVVVGGITTITNTTGSFINFPTTATGAMSSLVQYLSYPFAAPAAWQSGTNFPGSGIAFGTAVITDATGSDRIYYFGGTSALGTTAAGSLSAYWIDPPQPPNAWTSTWTSLASATMPTGRWGHGAVTLNQ